MSTEGRKRSVVLVFLLVNLSCSSLMCVRVDVNGLLFLVGLWTLTYGMVIWLNNGCSAIL